MANISKVIDKGLANVLYDKKRPCNNNNEDLANAMAEIEAKPGVKLTMDDGSSYTLKAGYVPVRVTSNNESELHDLAEEQFPLTSPTSAEAIEKVKFCMLCDESKCRFKCAKCLSVFYCSKYCQVNHWEAHKEICKLFTYLSRKLSQYRDVGGYNVVGSFAMHLRLKKKGISSEMVMAYAADPHGRCSRHAWIEVEKRIYDFSTHIKNINRKDMEYCIKPKKGAPMYYVYRNESGEQVIGSEETFAYKQDIVDFRNIKYNIDNARAEWIERRIIRDGNKLLWFNQLFTEDIVKEITGKSSKELEMLQFLSEVVNQ